ncbi:MULTISPECIES: DNA-methyltransferase [unclassified Gordonia (in: high G+C Gram-positive bacteria)]|uniref:DNA-methyltransferase n=1 Tax=unclassified Gordonia (in: high G+C Gram-positive bacteria) TaxID=2657482 RepID=UPI00071E4CE7|nr:MULTISPECIES: site-specific DNA-methyltransferase [unclassified Gordonia (in: high G+C Gram-positive bacteria)]SCC56112.1 DNA modification methylase [Gordonia sp. v-85]
MSGQIIVGDVRQHLPSLAEGSVDCIVTSPPYHRLRDYGHPDQMGQEATIHDWVDELRSVAAMLARVLRPDGTMWLNVGDGYAEHTREGVRRKGMLLGPQRLAVALADDGWIVRNQIIWHKPNGLPSSVRDRLSTQYEVVLLMTRAERYYFDLDAIRVPAATRPTRRRRPSTRPPGRPDAPPSVGPRPGDTDRGLASMKRRGVSAHPLGKSPGDVWSIPTAGYSGAHDATFPIALAERCILAGTPARICRRCQRPWLRAIREVGGRPLRTGQLQPQCTCPGGWRPGRVLDPFVGAGTTALAAEKHRRDWLGVELNPRYADQARDRIEQARHEHHPITE